MIRKAGYPAEGHIVQTNDGYLLTVHRIPGDKDQPSVLLQHGFLSSSADWVIPGKDKGLGTTLINFEKSFIILLSKKNVEINAQTLTENILRKFS